MLEAAPWPIPFETGPPLSSKRHAMASTARVMGPACVAAQLEPFDLLMPKYLNTWLNICSIVSIAVGRFLSGIKRQDLENLSTTTRMHVLPSDAGRSVTKSTPRCDHGRLGTGSGRSLPAGRWRGLFEMAHSSQPWTNLLTSLAMFGHQ